MIETAQNFTLLKHQGRALYIRIKFKYSKNLKLQIIKKKGSASAIRVRLIIREYKLKIGVLTRPPHPSDST